MSETTTQTNGVTSQYAAQVASDLERNLKEYDRVAAEAAVLQEQLASLEKDRVVLLNVQQALGVESASAAPAVEHTTAVPAPRKKASAGASRQSKAKKPEAAAPKVADKQTASRKASPKPAPKTAPKAASKAAPKTDQPSLVTLVREHLAGQSEPRSAAEVAQSLGQQHPERGIKTTVVRTTLEGLVAKNRAQRSKQGSSVFYTSPDAPASAPSKEGAEEDVVEGAPQ
ncbi:hypothetical protein OG342_02300 [Streptomyces bobili]|uniref:hypothetical protein n=1 Tax=Streptomyces bobili TaxID=67280 RepID=UPI00225B8D00|nr:hypothetical protein [Streptomyces bobili]MCX5521707.1 hypothetical protein [Streptomyces bobili]